MRELTNETALVSAIQEMCSLRCIVAVEGHSTSGKTTLSRRLAGFLEARLVSTDDFAIDGCRAARYVDCLDFTRLSQALDAARNANPILILEGICLRDTLSRAGIVPTLYVYVKRMTQAGLWADDLANYVKEGAPVPDLSRTDRWSVEYHLHSDPLGNATIVFVRHDD
jgi:hypothetical protein